MMEHETLESLVDAIQRVSNADSYERWEAKNDLEKAFQRAVTECIGTAIRTLLIKREED